MVQFYRRCLCLYPAEFRDEYGRELCMVFGDRWREERSLRVWLEALAGILNEAPKEHLHMIIRDLRFALRVLRKDATLTLAALAILALGIGATTHGLQPGQRPAAPSDAAAPTPAARWWWKR